MEGLLLLSEQVGKEKRPLSWKIGSQGIIKPEEYSLRDKKREERMKMTEIDSPDTII
jgi:NADH-quinone oxidoreductase subunit B